MHIVKNIDSIPEMEQPCGLTLGSFDGMHLGHQSLIDDLKNHVDNGSVAVFTFSNHPSHFLKNRLPTPFLCTLEHKLLLLKKAKINLVVLQEFDTEFSNIPYDVFLKNIKKHYPFSFFILGKGATFGKDRLGDEPHVLDLSQRLKFEAKYLKKICFNKQPISSGFIRHLIEGGDLTFASKLLGRPFSIYQNVQENNKDSGIFFYSIKQLCMPPQGSYAISALLNKKKYSGFATIDKETQQLKFKINDSSENLSGLLVELIFEKFLNQEMLF